PDVRHGAWQVTNSQISKLTEVELGVPVGHINLDSSSFSFIPPPRPHTLSMAPAIPSHLVCLFDYFIHRMTMSISCYKGIQDGICSTIVPMASQVPHLMSAVFALAAAHRQSSSLDQDDCQFGLMRGRSLKQLGSALNSFNQTERDQVLATTLILC